jgi:hypothetical protein
MSSAGQTFVGDDRSAQTRRRRGTIARLVDRALPRLPAGRLRLVLPNGQAILRQGDQAGPDATLAVQRWRALWRMLLDGDHGFADGYLDGDSALSGNGCCIGGAPTLEAAAGATLPRITI